MKRIINVISMLILFGVLFTSQGIFALNSYSDQSMQSIKQKNDKHTTTHADIEVIPVALTESRTMELLNTDWLNSAGGEEKQSEITKSISSTFWIFFSLTGLFVISSLVVIGGGYFSRMSLRLKLYTGFGGMVLLAFILGSGSYIYMGKVNGYSHLEAAFLDLDMMSGETQMTQNSFLLYGIQNKAFGERQVAEVETLLQAFQVDLDDISKNDYITDKQLIKVQELRDEVRAYKKNFNLVVSAYHQIENQKEELDIAAEHFAKNLEIITEHHEASLAKAEEDGTDLNEIRHQTSLVEHLMAAEIHSLKVNHAEVEFLLDKNPKHIGVMEKELGLFKGYLKAIERDLNDQTELRQIKEIEQAVVGYEEKLKNVIKNEAIIEKDVSEMNRLMAKFDETTAGLSHEIEASVESIVWEANIATVLLILVVILVGSTFAFFITRIISKPLNRITAGMNDSADQVASASGQVANAGQSLAEGAAEQAASIEETSASIEEMSSMTKQNADNAGQADLLMKEANQVVGAANSSMEQLTISMEEISKASEETSKIIKTIDEIAFQTNLLALNAAVEAARAGEAGAGFAVVADEVRNLAMRAANAAKDTSDLIEGTVKKVNDGSELVTKTNDAFKQVAESAKKVGGLVGEIAAASGEQAEGIEQVNKAVAEMDKVVQRNAANAEESAAASEEMSAQANQMKNMVGELDSMVNGSNKETNRIVTPLTTHPDNSRRKSGQFVNSRQLVVQEKKEIRPEKVIPLDDDFEDF